MTISDPVLVGHDGTGPAKLACWWADSLAYTLDADLLVAHAYSVGESIGGPESAAAENDTLLANWIAEDTSCLRPERISPVVVSDKPGPGLVQAAKMHGAGVVVIGAHDRPLRSSALGRVAHHVTFQSPCPVARVHKLGGPVASAPLVVGVDPESPNNAAFRWAQELASGLGVRLDVVTVSSNRGLMLVAEPLPPADDAVEFGPSEVHRLIGEPANELLRKAAEVDASAIIIGQRRRHNLGGRLLGRTASSVLHMADRPVIVFHHDS